MEKQDGRLKAAWIISLVCVVICAIYALIIGLGGGAIVGLSEDSAAVGGVIGGIMGFFCLLPLAWSIPMTVHMKKIADGDARNSLAFSICTLLFCNIISGILLLVVGGYDE